MVKKGKYPDYESAQLWCVVNGWSDLFEQEGIFYAFPPGAVMPLPVPSYQHLEEVPLTVQSVVSSLFSPKLVVAFALAIAIDILFFVLGKYHYRAILLPIGSLKAVSWIPDTIKLILTVWYIKRSYQIYELLGQGECNYLSGTRMLVQASANLLFIVDFLRLLQSLLFGLESFSN